MRGKKALKLTYSKALHRNEEHLPGH